MSKIQLQMNGLDELRQQLRTLPQDLASEAADVVLAHAAEAQQQISAGYPVRQTNLHRRSSATGRAQPPGILKARVTMLRNRALVFVSALVQSRAPHAHLFERGTRRRRTDKNYNRGRMPAAPEAQRMIPKVMRVRRKMIQALIAIVEKAGLIVEDKAA